MANTNPKDKSIKINIYGYSAAGKTTFLYELLSQLERKGTDSNSQRKDGDSGTRVKLNETAKIFLREVKKRRSRYFATRKDIEDISLSIRNDIFMQGNTGKRLIQDWGQEDWVTLIFHDVRGEEIRKRTANAFANGEDKIVIEKYVRDCQCLLFFFDPTHSDALKNESDLDTFHEGETDMASILLEHVPICRPQNPLPFLFIQTHRDKLELLGNEDPSLLQRADHWFDEVFDLLKRKYAGETPNAGYGRKDGVIRIVHQEILDREKNRFRINSFGDGEVFGPLKRLCEIKRKVDPHIIDEPKWNPVWKIVASVLAVVLLIAVIVCIRQTWATRNKQIQITVDSIQESTEKIRSIPSIKKPSGKDIKDAGAAISSARATLASHRANPSNKADREQIKDAINDLQEVCEKFVLDVLDGDYLNQNDLGSFERRVEYGRYFTEMKDEHIKLLSNPARQMLENNQRDTWKAAEELTCSTLKDLIERIRKTSPTPVEAMEKLKECLESLQTRWTELDHEIPASGSGRTMMKDIEVILDFCLARIKYGCYHVSEMSVTGTVSMDGKYDVEFVKQYDNKGEETGDIYCRTLTVTNNKVVPSPRSVPYYLPLDKRIPMTVHRASDLSPREKLFEGVITLKEESPLSLELFGMPLIRGGGTKTKVVVENARVELEMEFQHEYDLPDLFWGILE